MITQAQDTALRSKLEGENAKCIAWRKFTGDFLTLKCELWSSTFNDHKESVVERKENKLEKQEILVAGHC